MNRNVFCYFMKSENNIKQTTDEIMSRRSLLQPAMQSLQVTLLRHTFKTLTKSTLFILHYILYLGKSGVYKNKKNYKLLKAKLDTTLTSRIMRIMIHRANRPALGTLLVLEAEYPDGLEERQNIRSSDAERHRPDPANGVQLCRSLITRSTLWSTAGDVRLGGRRMVDLNVEVHVGRNIEQRHLAASDTDEVDRDDDNHKKYLQYFLDDDIVTI